MQIIKQGWPGGGNSGSLVMSPRRFILLFCVLWHVYIFQRKVNLKLRMLFTLCSDFLCLLSVLRSFLWVGVLRICRLWPDEWGVTNHPGSGQAAPWACELPLWVREIRGIVLVEGAISVHPPPCLWGLHARSNGCLKPRVVLNPNICYIFSIHT